MNLLVHFDFLKIKSTFAVLIHILICDKECLNVADISCNSDISNNIFNFKF